MSTNACGVASKRIQYFHPTESSVNSQTGSLVVVFPLSYKIEGLLGFITVFHRKIGFVESVCFFLIDQFGDVKTLGMK